MAWQRSTAERLGITWPPPKRWPGKPQRQQLWRELLYQQMKEGIDLPPSVTAEPPVGWAPGMSLQDLEQKEIEDSASSSPLRRTQRH
eukprot:6036934-Amphidinium_carterae.1